MERWWVRTYVKTARIRSGGAQADSVASGSALYKVPVGGSVGRVRMSGPSETRRNLLATVGERLVAIGRSAAAAGLELLAALREEEAAVAGEPAPGSVKQEDDKSKTEEEPIPVTTPALKQREQVFALEAPFTMQQDRNQETGMLAVETIVKNQEVMRSLMAELVKSMGAVERRIRNIEQEMGLITKFTQELNELGEDSWT